MSFGLVNVPVALVDAVRDLDLHFHEIHRPDAARIEVQRWCSKEDIEVPWEQIARGYELEDGREVVLTDEELEAIEPELTRTIEIQSFVDLDEIDPIYFDRPYFLVTASDDDGSRRAYKLLVEAMSGSDRGALGRFVMRAKEHVVLVRSRDGALTLSTMQFADEVRPRKAIDSAQAKSQKPSSKALDAAVTVIEELSTDWRPDRYKDEYRERLQQIVARKRRGEAIGVPARPESPEQSPDPMEALERTLAQIGPPARRVTDRPS